MYPSWPLMENLLCYGVTGVQAIVPVEACKQPFRQRPSSAFFASLFVERGCFVRTIAVDPNGLKPPVPIPRNNIGDVFHCTIRRHVDRLTDCTGEEWLCSSHHFNVCLPTNASLPFAGVKAQSNTPRCSCFKNVAPSIVSWSLMYFSISNDLGLHRIPVYAGTERRTIEDL